MHGEQNLEASARGFDFGFEAAPDPAREPIASSTRAQEAATVQALIERARLAPPLLEKTQELAATLAARVREKRAQAAGVDALMAEFSLDSAEGVALMCLAEALLRVPDTATRDLLIRDKVSRGDWRAHLGASPSLFVNAAAWGLLITGRLVDMHHEGTLERAIASLVRKGGEPLVRKGVDLAMRMLGEQFVTGRTIEEALANAREREARGYTFSFDMLGEAALTARDAARYFDTYKGAIHAIGCAANGRGIIAGPGISVKLSALHPRYVRAQRQRVLHELTPKVIELARLAKSYDIGLNIDAEEADRLELSLDVIEQIAGEASLERWRGLGVVVQAYQKRALPLVQWVIELARRQRRRLMLRLVKGAYWDTEIKRAQVDGAADYPVFTRKAHTDVCYLACAKAMLDAGDAIYPQFATHNAFSIAAIYTLAGDNEYEFQCLHGMGESIYDEIVGEQKLGRRCRIYAPVGSHETLLAYLVRRLLENGANTSFVNRIIDPGVSIGDLVADPVALAERTQGTPHPRIPLPAAMLPGRVNSRGIDLAADDVLRALHHDIEPWSGKAFCCEPSIADDVGRSAPPSIVRNPADHDDIVGSAVFASAEDCTRAVALAVEHGHEWSGTTPEVRAECLERAAELFEAERARFVVLAIREAGKTMPNAVGEVREAVDFCRYYAAQIRHEALGQPIGPIVAISPWNFPLAIFVGQVSAALAAGNAVLAKPAEETPLMAAEAVRVLHQAGVPRAALQLLPGNGEDTGAALVADRRIGGVIFTGSTEVARLIHRQLSKRDDSPLLIAETGGQNAMIVDSSALPEQVVADALASAFDSAGQRCSALRLLCLQQDIADGVLQMLYGALVELSVGDPRRLATDVGPVISTSAREALLAHIERMRSMGREVVEAALPNDHLRGTFVAPTVIDLGGLQDIGLLTGEVFGPVLHVVRWSRDELPALIDAINGTGYALTHGIHTRIDETVKAILARVQAGNVYVNRTLIGAVVGVQPFGGHGLSGTGPKAGGPFYVRRLTRAAIAHRVGDDDDWLSANRIDLPGPTGESNVLEFHPRGVAACIGDDENTLVVQARAAIAEGNTVLMLQSPAAMGAKSRLESGKVTLIRAFDPAGADVVLLDPESTFARDIRDRVAATPGKIVPIVVPDAGGRYDWHRLVIERTVTINTAAAGGNAALLSLAETGV